MGVPRDISAQEAQLRTGGGYAKTRPMGAPCARHHAYRMFMKISSPFVRVGIALFFLVGLFVGARSTSAQDAIGDFIPSDCMFEGIELGPTALTGEALGFECGYVVVPERHSAPDGPTIRLPVAVRRATSATPRSDPLLLAQGGPGGDAFEVFTLLAPTTSMAAERDIVVFNQRGTPYAIPDLGCPETKEVLPETLAATEEEGQRIYDQAIDACYARLVGEGIDLSAYNSLENAADVPLIVRALGYDEYNFYGVSYGTLLGLHLMRNHPEGLRSVILDSVVAPDVNYISELPASEDRVLSEVFAACEADATCRGQYPDLEERFFALVRRYDENPITISLVDPETGEAHDTYVDGTALRSLLFQLLYVPRMSAILPRIVADLEKGDTRYIESMWPLLVFDQLVAEGMYYSVVCAEDGDIDVDAIPVDTLRPEIAATARDDVQGYVDTCSRWQVARLPASVDDPVVSDIPTLLLSGRFDPVTPPEFARTAAAGLSNATVLVDPTGSHGVAFSNPCIDDVIQAFLDDPLSTLDAGCLEVQASLSTVPPDAVTLPLLADVNRLDTRIIWLFGLAAFFLVVVLSPFLVWPVVYVIRSFGDDQVSRAPEDRRWRWFSRGAILLFGVIALLFTIGFMGFILVTLVSDPTLLTALALPPSSRPVFWMPLMLVILAACAIMMTIVLWRRRGTGSTPGKVYYTLVVIAAVGFVLLLGSQGLLLPPL